jgi:soluble lytic murein transglycosylase-like protein
MSRFEDSEELLKQKTPGNWSGGLLFDINLPPLIVILLSLVMAWTLSQVTIKSSTPSPDQELLIAPLFTPEIQYWEQKINNWSDEWGLDPNIVATVMQIESCGDPSARSSAGAMGLFQVMPYHFIGNEDPYKPNINARRGLSFLKAALDAGNQNPRFALAGYNGGITGAKSPESDWPAETIRYVYWGLGIYEDAIKGKSRSVRLDEWLGAGGSSLCKAATEYLGIGP